MAAGCWLLAAAVIFVAKNNHPYSCATVILHYGSYFFRCWPMTLKQCEQQQEQHLEKSGRGEEELELAAAVAVGGGTAKSSATSTSRHNDTVSFN